VPCRKRAAYLARTPLLKSYSARIVSRSAARLLVFFIGCAFAPRGAPGGDESNVISLLLMRNYNQTTAFRAADQKEALLADGMGRVRYRDRKRIPKCRRRFGEGHTVLAEVRRALTWVPPEVQRHRLNLAPDTFERTA